MLSTEAYPELLEHFEGPDAEEGVYDINSQRFHKINLVFSSFSCLWIFKSSSLITCEMIAHSAPSRTWLLWISNKLLN